jgi:Protein of unknown function with HXXEE motif
MRRFIEAGGDRIVNGALRDDRIIVRLALLAPVIFILHVVEEAPGFVEWFNSLVEPDITGASFLTVNGTAFVITVILSGALAASREPAVAVADLAWLGFLMLANGLLHLTATVVHQRYSPGTLTAAALYLPYFAVLFAAVRSRLRVSAATALVATVLGALPMAVHGYLIIFRGSRLF